MLVLLWSSVSCGNLFMILYLMWEPFYDPLFLMWEPFYDPLALCLVMYPSAPQAPARPHTHTPPHHSLAYTHTHTHTHTHTQRSPNNSFAVDWSSSKSWNVLFFVLYFPRPLLCYVLMLSICVYMSIDPYDQHTDLCNQSCSPGRLN